MSKILNIALATLTTGILSCGRTSDDQREGQPANDPTTGLAQEAESSALVTPPGTRRLGSGSAPYTPSALKPSRFASFADVNGDGRADLVFHSRDNRFIVSLSTGSRFQMSGKWANHGGPFLAGSDQYRDFDGDGDDDLMYQTAANGFMLSVSDGKAFGKPVVQAQVGGVAIFGQAQFAPLFGAGLPGLMFQRANAKGQNEFLWSDAAAPAPKVVVTEGDPAFVQGQAQYADVSGDGMADFIYQNDSNNFYVSLGKKDGSTFSEVNQLWSTKATWSKAFADELVKLQTPQANGALLCPGVVPKQCASAFGFGQVQYTDVDGDGKADLLYQDCNNWIYASRSTGKAFATPELWATNCGAFESGYTTYADVDGSGKAALVQMDNQGLRVATATPTGFAKGSNVHSLNFPAGVARSDIPPGHLWRADFNGDGRHDLAIQTMDAQVHVSLSNVCPSGATCPNVCAVASEKMCRFAPWTGATDLTSWAPSPAVRTGDDHVALVGFYSHEHFRHLDNELVTSTNAANVAFIWDDTRDVETYAKAVQRRVSANALMGLKSIVEVQTVFFGDDAVAKATGCRTTECHWPHRADFARRWQILADAVKPYAAYVAGFYLYDEPLYWLEDAVRASRPGSRSEAYRALQRSAAEIDKSFPLIPSIVIENKPKAESIVDNASDPSFPAEIDLLGFDCYDQDFVGCDGPRILDGLKRKFKSRSQRLVIVPPATFGANASSHGNFCAPGPAEQAELQQKARSWFNAALADPMVAAVLPWTAHSDLSAPAADGSCLANIFGVLDDKWGTQANGGTKANFLKMMSTLLHNPAGAYTVGSAPAARVIRLKTATPSHDYLRFNDDGSILLTPLVIDGTKSGIGRLSGGFPGAATLQASGWAGSASVATATSSALTIAWSGSEVWTMALGETASLDGTWQIARPGKQSPQIVQNGRVLTFINENGGVSSGWLIDAKTVVAFDWSNLRGSLTVDSAGRINKISWGNGSAWSR